MEQNDNKQPDYANFDAPAKFQAIQSIIAKRLKEHPNACCSYSGGSDSDIMIDLIERTREAFNLPSVKYMFFNTGLEMKVTKDHVKETAKKYGVEIEELRPEVNIVNAVRRYGVPLISKLWSEYFQRLECHSVPLTIADEFEQAVNKKAKLAELYQRYPKCKTVIQWLCGVKNSDAEPCINSQFVLSKELREFMIENPIDFHVSAKCCDYCKKDVAHKNQKDFDILITGERKAEGGYAH